eukprot:567480_1
MALSKDGFDTAMSVIDTLQLLQCIAFLALYIHSYCRIRSKVTDGISLYIKLIMNLSLLFITSYTLRYLIVVIMDYTNSAENDLMEGIKDLLFVVGHSSFYLIMISRLYFVFRDSAHALSKRTIYILIGSWILINVIDSIYFIVAASTDDTPREESFFFFVLVLLDVILGTALIAVFTQKLFEMATALEIRKDTEEIEDKSDSDHEDMYPEEEMKQDNTGQTQASKHVAQESGGRRKSAQELSETQMILVGAAAKYALLCGTTILFINLQFFTRAITILSQRCSYGCEITLSVWFVLALFMEFVTIYLSFPCTGQQYEKVCGGCHKIFEGIFRVRMMDKMQRREAEAQNQLRHVCCLTLRR